MTKHSKNFWFELPSKKENEKINAEITADPDTFSPTKTEFTKMRLHVNDTQHSWAKRHKLPQ